MALAYTSDLELKKLRTAFRTCKWYFKCLKAGNIVRKVAIVSFESTFAGHASGFIKCKTGPGGPASGKTTIFHHNRHEEAPAHKGTAQPSPTT